MPATTPSSVDSGTMQANAMAASSAVFARCLKITSLTGSLNRAE
jgi:hypothetical protein